MGPNKKQSSQQSSQQNINRYTTTRDEEEPPEWAKQLTNDFREVGDRLSSFIDHVESRLKETDSKIDNARRAVEEKIEDIEFNSRKYNLIFLGIQGLTSDNCEARVRSFMKKDLDLSNADDFKMAACYPLRGENSLIVRFVSLNDRDMVLRNGFKLKGKKIQIKTDLPDRLRLLRSELFKQAAGLRGQGKIVRVRERGRSVFIEEKASGSGGTSQWKKI